MTFLGNRSRYRLFHYSDVLDSKGTLTLDLRSYFKLKDQEALIITQLTVLCNRYWNLDSVLAENVLIF